MFQMSLSLPDNTRIQHKRNESILIELTERVLPEERNDFLPLQMIICDHLEDTNLIHFNVSGFGQKHWPVDVRTDLSTILTQVEDSFIALGEKKNFDLFFYEQGIERNLQFKWESCIYRVHCQSLSDWEPNPINEYLSHKEIRQQLTDLVNDFTRATYRVFPNIGDLPAFVDWRCAIGKLLER